MPSVTPADMWPAPPEPKPNRCDDRRRRGADRGRGLALRPVRPVAVVRSSDLPWDGTGDTRPSRDVDRTATTRTPVVSGPRASIVPPTRRRPHDRRPGVKKTMAVILAGGEGERLSILSQKRAKPA